MLKNNAKKEVCRQVNERIGWQSSYHIVRLDETV